MCHSKKNPHTQTSAFILCLTHEQDKKEAINLTFNKTSSQKIYSDYAKCPQKNKKNLLLFSKWAHVKKLHAPSIRTGTQKRFITDTPEYAKPSGKRKLTSGWDWRRGNVNKTAKRVIKSTIRANTFHRLRRREIVKQGVRSRGRLIEAERENGETGRWQGVVRTSSHYWLSKTKSAISLFALCFVY